MLNGITLLICTYNGAPRIEKTLQHILRQKFTKKISWEVIVMDNASSDNTSELVKKAWNNPDIPFKLIREDRPGKHNALETGFLTAKFDVVCIVDDDNRINEKYVEQVYTIMNDHPEVGLVGGRGIGDFETEPPAWFPTFEEGYGIGPQGKEAGYNDKTHGYLYGASSAVRKEAWQTLHDNGFTLLLSGRKGKTLASGEDMEMCLAIRLLGYRLWYDPEITFEHFMPAGRLNWDYTKRMFAAFGRAALVTDEYRFPLYEHKWWKKVIHKSAFLEMLYAFYDMFRKLPQYIVLSMKNSEGDERIVWFGFAWAKFTERLKNLFRAAKIKRMVKNAEWRKHARTFEV